MGRREVRLTLNKTSPETLLFSKYIFVYKKKIL